MRQYSLLILACLTLAPAVASAQIGMAEDERAAVGINPAGLDHRNGHGTIYNDGTLSMAPLSYDYTNHIDGNGGAYSDVVQQSSADFGHLGVNTSGDAQSSNETGCSLWSTTFIGADEVVSFRDVITASQDTDVAFDFKINGASSFQGNADGGTYAHTTWYYSFYTANGSGDPALNGISDQQATVHLTGGQQYSLFVGLGWDCSANSNDTNSRFSSFAMNADGVVTLSATTPGANLSSLSGHVYAAPEPVSLAALGLGALGLVRRKKQPR